MTVTELRTELTTRRRLLDRRMGEAEALLRRGRAAQTAAKGAQSVVETAEEAARLLARYADQRQARVVSAIQSVVSAGLTTVFGEPVELKLTQLTRARRVEIDITVKTGQLETPILDARGGGMAAIAAFLLRATTLLLTRDARRLIVADEPFAQVSAHYAPRMAEFVAELCKATGLQCVLVTHSDAFSEVADKVIRLKTDGNKTVVEK